jgi:hypothetical protein
VRRKNEPQIITNPAGRARETSGAASRALFHATYAELGSRAKRYSLRRWRIGAEPHAGNGVEKSRSASSSMGFGLRLRFLAGMKKEIARVKNRTIKGELHGCCAKSKIN